MSREITPVFWPSMQLKRSRGRPLMHTDVSMRELIDRHKVFFIDSYGVLRGRQGYFPGVDRTLQEILRQGKKLGIATNNAMSTPEDIQAEMREQGIDIPLSLIFSSGMVLKAYVEAHGLTDKPAIILGPEGSHNYASKARLKPISSDSAMDRISEAELIVISEDPFRYPKTLFDAACNAIFTRNIPVVQTTTDRLVNYGNTIGDSRLSAGVDSSALIIKGLTGKSPEIIGKPAQGMFNMLAAALQEMGYQKGDALFIGDNLHEDVVGAVTAGFPVALVETGISGAITRGEIRGPLADWDRYLLQLGYRPTYRIPSVLLD